MCFKFFLSVICLSSFSIPFSHATEFIINESATDYLGSQRRAITLRYTGPEIFTQIVGFDAKGNILNTHMTSHDNTLILLDDEQHHLSYYATFSTQDSINKSVFQYVVPQKTLTQKLAEAFPTGIPFFSVKIEARPYDGSLIRAISLIYTGPQSFDGIAGFCENKNLLNIKCDPTESVLFLLENGPYEVCYYSSPDPAEWTPQYMLFTYTASEA